MGKLLSCNPDSIILVAFRIVYIIYSSASFFLTPVYALVIMYLVEVPTVIYLMPNAFKKGSFKVVLPMIIALILTIPIGFYFVISINAETIRIVISILVISMVFLLASGWKPKGEIKL